MEGKTFQIVDFQHVKPGKGPAFVRTKLKNLENGRVLDNTFSAGAKVEFVRVERRPYQFTYEDDLGAHFMHTETFEEINIDKALITNYDLMADGQIVEVMFHTEKETVLSAELPPIVDMEVTYTEPGVKGDTASTNSLKPATVNTGATVRVPLFINTGDKIRVDNPHPRLRGAHQVANGTAHGKRRPSRRSGRPPFSVMQIQAVRLAPYRRASCAAARHRSPLRRRPSGRTAPLAAPAACPAP